MYLRLSREDEDKIHEADPSQSINNQKDFITNYAEENSFIIVDTYCDDGISGTTFERADFQRMIADIESKKINMVITKDLSRLGRDYIQTGYYLEKYFPEKNVRFIAINDGYDSFGDSSANEMAPFKSVFNDMYAKDISKKIKGVFREKELNGEYLGTIAPYGYKKSSTQKNKLEIDTNVACNVKRIFELYSEGNGFQRIATMLDRENIKPPSQYLNMKHQRETWNPKSIRAILVNEAYIGNTVQNKCVSVSYKVKKKIKKVKEEYIRVENTHEPIVSKELFEKVQEIIKAKKSMSATKHDFLFKGLMFCHNCGRQSRVCYRGKKEKIGYIDCSLARGKERKCKTCNYNYNKFEEKTLNTIRNICQTYCDKNALKTIYERCQSNYEDLIRKEEYNLKNVEKQIDEITKKIDKMYFDNLNGIITNDDYFRYSRGFIEERDRLKKENKNIKTKITLINNRQKDAKHNEDAQSIINEFLKFEKPSRKILYELIDRVELDENKNIYIYFNFSELNVLNTSINIKK